MAAFINLSVQGTIYFTSCRHGKDSDMMELFSNLLSSRTKESTFGALYSQFYGKWRQQDDVIHPFHERRCADDNRYAQIESVWTFDIDNDILRNDKENSHGMISLDLVRRAPFTGSDLIPYTPLTCAGDMSPIDLPPPYWKTTRQGLDPGLFMRRKALLSRILNDFAFQWRHVLCGPYNNNTFLRLAYAIVRVVSLDFTIKEIDTPRYGTRGLLVKLQDLPEWKTWHDDIIRVGGVSIVVCQHVPHALSLVQKDFQKWTVCQMKQYGAGHANISRTYLIFSRHSITLHQINENTEKYTKAERLFVSPPAFSPEAIDLLLKATQKPAAASCVNRLANELQDMILDKITVGPLQRAKIGCNLNIGAPFKWKSDSHNIEREEGCRNRTAETPVESQIWFDDCFSGLAYK